MLKKITISILLFLPITGITTSYANEVVSVSVTAPTQVTNNYALHTNMKYIEKIKTPNIVLNETYKAYILDFESRYKVADQKITEYNKTQDVKLTPLNLKIAQIKKDFDEEANELYLANLINTEINNFSSTITPLTKNKLNNQETVINSTFPDESKVFLKIFQTTLKDYDVTQEEKTYLEGAVKEFVKMMKDNPITSTPDVYKTALDSIVATPSSYQYFDAYQKFILDSKVKKFDKSLFNVMWSKARSNSVYPK